jgi:hypothetical protein
MVPAEGFEPPTYGLQNRCTTTVLSRQIKRASGSHIAQAAMCPGILPSTSHDATRPGCPWPVAHAVNASCQPPRGPHR